MMEPISILTGKRIILGVTGSIACYKAIDLASKLTQAGALVDVIMTDAAQKFVTPLSFQAVTGGAVYTDLWQTDAGGGLPTHIAHVGLSEAADLLAIMPATADTLARLAHGQANDLLAITALAVRCPVLCAPAMDGAMYSHPATQANVALLRERGIRVVEPETGRFASGLIGVGRLPETPTLLGAIRSALGQNGSLRDRRIIVTAGGTREALDPVRYLTNHSSGKQGYALAQAALDAGANVTLITAARGQTAPYGAHVVPVDSADEMLAAVLDHTQGADALIMAAAVADFRPAEYADQKIKKSADNAEGWALPLARTSDILATVAEKRAESGFPRHVVAFAAESQQLLENAQDKLVRKGADMLVANDITQSDAGFDVDTNRVTLLFPNANPEPLPLMSKTAVSEAIVARLAELLA